MLLVLEKWEKLILFLELREQKVIFGIFETKMDLTRFSHLS
jgi:hypothetical protein